MVKILLNLEQVPRPDDAADALGIAICQTYAGARAGNMPLAGGQSASRGSPAPKGSSRRKSGR